MSLQQPAQRQAEADLNRPGQNNSADQSDRKRTPSQLGFVFI